MTGSIKRHQDRLCLSAVHESIPKVILSRDHRKRYLSLGMIVIRWHIGMKRKRKELVAVFVVTLRQSFGIGIPIAASEDVGKANVQIVDKAVIDFRYNAIMIDYKPQRIVDQPLESSCEALPFGRTIAQRYLLDFSQQVYDTPLLGKRLDSIIGGEKVGDQYSFESIAKYLLDHGSGSGWSQNVIGQLGTGETLQSNRASQYPPAAFVDAQNGGQSGFHCKAIVNRFEDFCQPLPLQYQASGSHGKLAEGTQPCADIARRYSQGMVQKGREKGQAQTYGCFRQSLGYRSRYFLPTRRAIIFVSDMFRCRTDGRNVFHNPGMFATRHSYSIVTVWAFGQSVFYCLIDMNRSSSPNTEMSILAPWLVASFPSSQLAVGRTHGRSRRQRNSIAVLWGFGFEIFLELGVLLLQLRDSLLFLLDFPLQGFVFPLQIGPCLIPGDRSVFVVFRKERKKVAPFSRGRGLSDNQLWNVDMLD
jgi:hypothetical protein